MLAYLALAGLLICPAWQGGIAVTLTTVLLLLALNHRLYGFFRRKRGVVFASRAVAAHWAYYLTCGAGFLAGFARHALRRIAVPAHAPVPVIPRPDPAR
jgi:hypothetical protein